MPWEVAISDIQNAIKTPFLGDLLETFNIHSLETILVHIFRVLKIWKFREIFVLKNKIIFWKKISKFLKLSIFQKSEISVLQPILFWVSSSFPIVFIFKIERVTSFPANPYFRSKSAEHDVTLTSFAADPSKVERQNCHMCKIDAKEGIENLVIVRQTVWEIWWENERGGGGYE